MSITQTYYLAHKARAKLSSEAGRPDHNLRLLVGHANLLDSLMLELADAEREQESWFNQSVRASTPKTEERHVQWADTIVEEPEQDWRAEDAESDSDSDSEYDEEEDEDVEMAGVVSLRRVPSNRVPPPPTMARSDAMDFDEDFEDDEEEDYAELTLSRTSSHSASPPELDHDDESSEDESMPPSPPQTLVHSFTDKQREAIATTGFYESTQEPSQASQQHKSFYEEGFYVPPRNPARLVSAISVY